MIFKNILNWTLGGFFRTLGKFLLYLCVAILIGILLSNSNVKIPHFGLFGMVVKADTITHSSDQYNVYVFYQTGADSCLSGIGQGYKNLDTSSNLTEYTEYYNNAVSRVDYLTNVNLVNGTQYSFDVTLSFNPKSNITSYNGWSYSIEGSTTTNSSGLTGENITSYNCYITNVTNNNYQVKLHCDFIPKYTLQKLYVRVNTGCTAKSISYFNTYTMIINSVGSTENSINQQTTDLINNQNSNTQEIIDNQNQNTQDIIDAGNQNAQQIIDSNKVCSHIDKNNIVLDNKRFASDGTIVDESSDGITDYIKILGSSVKMLTDQTNRSKYTCFYNVNKVKLSCINTQNISSGTLLTLPNDSYYMRVTIHKNDNKPQLEVCTNGSQAIQDTIEDTDTSSESNDTIDFMNDFTSDSDSLISSLVTIPLTFIQSLVQGDATDLCTTFKGQQICFPNGQKTIWNKANGGHFCSNDYFGCADSQTVTAFKNFFNLVCGGFLAYKLIKDAIRTIHNWLEPTESKVEVMTL